MKNRPGVDEIHPQTPADVLAELPLDVIDQILYEAAERIGLASETVRVLNAEIERRYGDRFAALRMAAGKDTGTVTVHEGSFKLVANLPKRVSWDQAQLATIYKACEEADDDPAEYLDVSLSVPEKKYNAWPSYLRDRFKDARTVGVGKQSIKLEASK